MSPLLRRYRVTVEEWDCHQIVVTAATEDTAVASAQRVYDRQGLGAFETTTGSKDLFWYAQEVQS